MIAILCATPALQLKTWDSLQTKTASAATGYTLRGGMVPSSSPQATIKLVPHGDVNPKSVVFYRDTNAWCPFCERVYLYLLEADIEHEQTFVDISPGKKPDWYKDVIPTGQTPSLSLGGKPVWESNPNPNPIPDPHPHPNPNPNPNQASPCGSRTTSSRRSSRRSTAARRAARACCLPEPIASASSPS